MPTYDYVCSSCGRVTEVVHSINASGPAACPACGAVGTLTKAFNPPTIHFKGSGWAKKDRSGVGSKPSRAPDSSTKDGSGGERAAAGERRDDALSKDAPGGEGKGGEIKGGEIKGGEIKGGGAGEGKGGNESKAGESRARSATTGSSSRDSSSASAD